MLKSMIQHIGVRIRHQVGTKERMIKTNQIKNRIRSILRAFVSISKTFKLNHKKLNFKICKFCRVTGIRRCGIDPTEMAIMEYLFIEPKQKPRQMVSWIKDYKQEIGKISAKGTDDGNLRTFVGRISTQFMIFVVTSKICVQEIFRRIPTKKQYSDQMKTEMYTMSLKQITGSMNERVRKVILKNVQSHADVF